MNEIPYEERRKVYTNALISYGESRQLIVALEELSECQRLSAKLCGAADFRSRAEEVADATIMLEQIRMIFSINEEVCRVMDQKVMRLDRNLKKEAGIHAG